MGVNIQSYNKKLLARPEQNLEDHLKEVSEYGISYLKENLKEEFTEEKEKIYKAGLFFHDVGKSEISIQNAYYNKKKPPIFHTHLSVIFFYSWLIDFLKKDLYELLNDKKLKVISFCILSHHGPPHRKLEYNIFSQILNKDKKISIAKEVFGILKSFDFCVTEKTFIDTYNKFIKGYGENIYEFHFATALTPDLRKSFSIFYNALVKSDWYSAMGIPPTFQVKSATKVSLPSDFLEPERSEVHKYIHERQEFKENILLELPTGFGKTFLGLGYALKTKRKRIIYTLPVTTIIEDVYENSLKKYINEKYLE
ncbi:MAG: CRISPR-associated endonuclease Cas3'', partial [Thermosulfidibacteraceae bacterium]